MAVIQVETPDGIKQVEIAGETPTTEEEEALFNTFFAEQSPTQSPTQPSTELDFATGL